VLKFCRGRGTNLANHGFSDVSHEVGRKASCAQLSLVLVIISKYTPLLPFTMVALSIVTLLSLPLALALSDFFDSSLRQTVQNSILQVELQILPISGNIKAIITNSGSSIARFSTDQNILSTDPDARKLQVINAENEPVGFTRAAETFYAGGQIPAKEFQTLLPRTSITREIKIVSYFDLRPNQTYFIQAAGFVPFYIEGQDSVNTQTALFESNVLRWSSPHTIPPISRADELQSSAKFLLGACQSKALQDNIKKAATVAADMAKKAASHAMDGKDRASFIAYFKKDSPENRKKVSGRLSAIAAVLSNDRGPIKIVCGDGPKSPCARGGGALAWTEVSGGNTFICPQMVKVPTGVANCDSTQLPGILIHELTHSTDVYKPSTDDLASEPQRCKALSEARALMNANSYNLYAVSVYLGKVC
jgi:deuterolysin